MKSCRIIALSIAILCILHSTSIARYYNPQTGRYLTPDPIGIEGGINPYVYVNGDPVNKIDPSGKAPCDCDEKKACEEACKAYGGMEFCGKVHIPILGDFGGCKCKYDTSTRQGRGRAPHNGDPNSIYEQVDESGNVRSRTYYDENGHSFTRQDYDHSHGGMQPHEHTRAFDQQGRPITPEDVHDLPPGY